MEIKDRLYRHGLLLAKSLVNRDSHCQNVLFIAGMQRSGTNMLMDALERSFATDVYHEWDERAFVNYQMRDRAVIRGLLRKSHGKVFVIKALCELQELTELMTIFENSKTIWIFRQYQDVVNSMIRSFGNMDKQIIRLANDPDSEAWLGKGMSEQTSAVLRDIVKPDISLASASALQWYIRNVLFFEQGFESNEKVLPVIYEQLVDIPKCEMERIFSFANINYSERIIRNIHSGSVGRRESPVIDAKIKELCSSLQQKITGL
jgi:hypothetical protein